MSIYDRYIKLISDKINEGQLTPEFIQETTYRLSEFLKKGKIIQEQYDELIELMNSKY